MASDSTGTPISPKQTRRRVKTKRFDFDYLNNEDQRLLQQVLYIIDKDSFLKSSNLGLFWIRL